MKMRRYECLKISRSKKLLKTEVDKKRGFAYVPVVLNFLLEKYNERLLIHRIYEDEKIIWSNENLLRQIRIKELTL